MGLIMRGGWLVERAFVGVIVGWKWRFDNARSEVAGGIFLLVLVTGLILMIGRAWVYKGETQWIGAGRAAVGTWERRAFKTFQKLMSLFQFWLEICKKSQKVNVFLGVAIYARFLVDYFARGESTTKEHIEHKEIRGIVIHRFRWLTQIKRAGKIRESLQRFAAKAQRRKEFKKRFTIECQEENEDKN